MVNSQGLKVTKTSRFENGVIWAARVGALLGALCVVVSMLIITFDVFSRKFLGFSILFAEELSQNLLVGLTFLGLAFALKAGAHIDVSMAVDHMPIKLKKFCELCAASFGLVYCIIVTWIVGKLTITSFTGGFTYWGTLHTPLYLIQMLMPIGFLLFGLTFILEIVKAYRSWRLTPENK